MDGKFFESDKIRLVYFVVICYKYIVIQLQYFVWEVKFIFLMTSTRSWQAYETLCSVMEKNDIYYEKDDHNLCVKCSVSGEDIQLNFAFVINPVKMLITLYSLVPVKVRKEKSADMAIAVCMINNNLTDGSFCFDTNDGTIFFKMTSSFCDTNVTEELFEYMLSVAADTMDDYFLKIKQIEKSEQPFSENNRVSAMLTDFFRKKN